MAKGDYVEVIYGTPGEQSAYTVRATGAGQKVEAEWDDKKGRLRVSQLTRNGNPVVVHEFSAAVVLRVSQKIKAE